MVQGFRWKGSGMSCRGMLEVAIHEGQLTCWMGISATVTSLGIITCLQLD